MTLLVRFCPLMGFETNIYLFRCLINDKEFTKSEKNIYLKTKLRIKCLCREFLLARIEQSVSYSLLFLGPKIWIIRNTRYWKIRWRKESWIHNYRKIFFKNPYVSTSTLNVINRFVGLLCWILYIKTNSLGIPVRNICLNF